MAGILLSISDSSISAYETQIKETKTKTKTKRKQKEDAVSRFFFEGCMSAYMKMNRWLSTRGDTRVTLWSAYDSYAIKCVV